MQLQEIVGLQQHVAEFREGDPSLEAGLHRFLLQHVVHGEMLPNVAHELDRPERPQPLCVVYENRCVALSGILEPQKALELRANATHILLDLLKG